MDFNISQSDTSLFFKSVQGPLLLVLVCVSDIIVTGSNLHLILQVITNLQSTFALKKLGELSYFRRIQATQNHNGLYF